MAVTPAIFQVCRDKLDLTSDVIYSYDRGKMTKNEIIIRCACDKCTHSWQPKDFPPMICPMCKSYKWNEKSLELTVEADEKLKGITLDILTREYAEMEGFNTKPPNVEKEVEPSAILDTDQN